MRSASALARAARCHLTIFPGGKAGLLMNARRFEIRENGWIEIEDQALETGPKEAEAPSWVNGVGNGANGSFLPCQHAS